MAFITNFQSPFELDELRERFEDDGATNIDYILRGGETLGDWTVDKDCLIGDTVFFMCAKTSIDHIGHVCAEARKNEARRLFEFAERERALYKRYAGSIMAIGKVSSEPYESDSGYKHAHWRNPWYATIGSFRLLQAPVHIDQFRDFITINTFGAITKLDIQQTAKLLDLVAFCNVR